MRPTRLHHRVLQQLGAESEHQQEEGCQPVGHPHPDQKAAKQPETQQAVHHTTKG
ncbi:MAG: hypothetical protein R2810_08790 [Flavobacteriales bacterium]